MTVAQMATHYGRRKMDELIGTALLEKIQNGDPITLMTLPPKEKKTRRPRRSVAEREHATQKAFEALRLEHPRWSNRRRMIRARNMVRLYLA